MKSETYYFCTELRESGPRITQVYEGSWEGKSSTPCGNYHSFDVYPLIGPVTIVNIPIYEPEPAQELEFLEKAAKRIKEEMMEQLERALDPIMSRMTELKQLTYQN